MKLNNRQKLLVTLIVIALAYVLWQVYIVFIRDNQSSAAPVVSTPAPQPSSVVTPSANPAPTSVTANPSSPPSNQPIQPAPGTVQPAPAVAVPTQNGFTLEAPVSEYQNQYIELVNRYQLLRMQRMIVDEEASIATAKERIVAIDQKIGQLGGAGTGALSDGTTSAEAMNPAGYKLMYIDFQGGQWSATLSRDGHFLEVNVDDNLFDGTRVIRINQQGVVIQQKENQYLLTFYGTKNLGQVKPVQLDDTLGPAKLFTPAQRSKPLDSPLAVPSAPANKMSAIPQSPVKQETITTTKTITPLALPPVSGSPKKAAPGIIEKQETTITRTIMSPVTTPAVTVPSKPAPLVNKPQQQQKTTTTTTTTTKTIAPLTTTPSSVPHIPGTHPLQPQSMRIQIPDKPTKPPAPTVAIAVPDKPPINTPQPIQANKPAATPAVVTTPSVPAPVVISKLQPPAPAPAAAPVYLKPGTSPVSFAQDRKYLLAMPGSYYVIQIMGSRNREDLLNLIRQYHLTSQIHGFQSNYLNKNWYVLVYGVYKNSQDATAALAELPRGVQQLKPWVRSVASIHDAIQSGTGTKIGMGTRTAKNNNEGIQL